jgi:hypothetical protein
MGGRRIVAVNLRRQASGEMMRRLREANDMRAKGMELPDVLEALKVSEATYDHWRAREAHAVARRVGISVSAVALIMVCIHAAFPDLEIDTVAVALLALAALPWLGDILESVNLPGGGGWKYRSLERQVVQVQHAASEAKQAAAKAFDHAENVADDVAQERDDAAGTFALNAQAVDPKAIADAPVDDSTDDASRIELAALIARYNEVRATQRSGFPRTAAMTGIVREMIRLTGRLTTFQWEESLKSADRGTRLAAYAYVYSRPTCSAASPLIHSLMEIEDKPFGQYWALKALRLVIADCDDATARSVEPILRDFAARLGPATDRGRELQALLHEIGAREVA